MWSKGQSGNPRGRPKKKYAITDLLRKQLKKKTVKDKKTGKMYPAQLAIVQKLILCALTGDIIAIRTIIDRVDGPVTQIIEAAVERKKRLDLSRLTTEELETLEKLTAKAEGKQNG